MATLTDHCRTIIRQIQALAINKGLPSRIGLHTASHAYPKVSGGASGDFLLTVESVPCYVETASASSGNPSYKISEGTVATTAFADDAAVYF